MTNEEMNEYGNALNEMLDTTLLDLMQAKRQANKAGADDDAKQAWQLFKAVLKVEDVRDNDDLIKSLQGMGLGDNPLWKLLGESNE